MRAAIAPLAALHVAVLLFGLAGLFGKWIELPPAWIVLGRTVFAATMLGVVATLARMPLRWSLRLAGNGIVLAVHWMAFFAAIQAAGVAIGLLGYASFPLFVLLLERAVLGTRLDARKLVVAALVTGGLLLLVPEFSLDNRAFRGLLWGVLSGFTFALLAVWNRAAAVGRAPLEVAFWQNAAAAFCLVPMVWLVPAVPTGKDVALLAVLGIVCTAGAHTLFIASLRTLSAHTASVVAALEPVYGIALAIVLLGEVPAARTLAGGALVIAAALVASAGAEQRAPVP